MEILWKALGKLDKFFNKIILHGFRRKEEFLSFKETILQTTRKISL